MKEQILECLKKAVTKLGIDASDANLSFPDNVDHGDYTTNIALISAGKSKTNPRKLAEEIVKEIEIKTPDFLESVTIAGPGFINFKIKEGILAKEVVKLSEAGDDLGKSQTEAGKKILIEYTDPNTFKAFHIGHLMANAIGESLSRLIECSGASVTRLCYAADIGLHIAKAIWAWQRHLNETPADDADIIPRTAFLGKMYVEGTKAYDDDPIAKKDIDALNKVIYDKSDDKVMALYEKGRKWSLDHFELLYKLLDTKFDAYLYESEMATVGLKIVKENMSKVFKESDGAIVFHGEDYGLHTRVFINSVGLPTYEAKDMGLNATKFSKYPDIDQSIIVTASEQNEYFKVILKALSLFDKEAAAKTMHIGHGMMRFASGKMSSRTGNVITAESLLADVREMVAEKIASRGFGEGEATEISDIIAVGAIKYSVLRSAIGSDIIFDSAKSISFEGDSGPYLQYSAVRAASILEKAKQEGVSQTVNSLPEKVSLVEKLLIRFPEIISRAKAEYAPQGVANYLMSLAGAFNSFYASQVIVDKNDKLSPYYVALTKAFRQTMVNGLWVLGIKVPEKM